MDLQKAKELQVTNELVYWLEGKVVRSGRVFNVTANKKIKVQNLLGEFVILEPEKVVTGTLTTGNIAKLFGVSTTTVWRWLDNDLVAYTGDGLKKGWRSISIASLGNAMAEGKLPPRRGRPSMDWIADIAAELKISVSYVRQLRRRGIFSNPPTGEEIEAFKSRPRKWG